MSTSPYQSVNDYNAAIDRGDHEAARQVGRQVILRAADRDLTPAERDAFTAAQTARPAQ